MMKMTNLEKQFVNRKQKGEQNIVQVCECLNYLDLDSLHTVLELGCGLGVVSAFLAAEYKMKVVGTDFDLEQIELARSLNHETARLHYQVEDATHLTFQAGSFDLVIAQNVFHHIPVWPKAGQEIARILRSGGYFIWFDLAVPGLIKHLLKPVAGLGGLYTFDEIRSEFLKCGFRQMECNLPPSGSLMHHQVIFQKV